MNTAEGWSVMLSVTELDGETHAEAQLITGAGSHLSGHGKARRNPADQNVTKIGEEIAVARALSDLAYRLLHAAATDVEAVTHERPRLHM
jgi:hypothetical protein